MAMTFEADDGKKKWKLVISDEAMADLDKIPEADAQELIDAMQAAVDDGSLFDKMTPVDMEQLKREEPEIYERLTGETVEGQ